MTSIQHWTPEQWAVFTATIAAGVIAAAVLAVLSRTRRRWPPALRRVFAPPPRPSIVMTERRTMRERYAAIDPVAFRQESLGTWTDPMAADYTDPGIGALSSIKAITVDPTLRTETEIEADERAWVGAYADLSGFMPETDAAAEQMRVNLEPALRKARAWRIRGEGGAALQALNDWRMNTPTGEWPMLTTAGL